MSKEAFQALIKCVTDDIAGRPIDSQLETYLNTGFPADGPAFTAIETACHQAIAEGWVAHRDNNGVKFSRVFQPMPELSGFSVDVVKMADTAGLYHGHPTGEVDMIMPVTPGATFDGAPRGWKVYAPGTEHPPTVAGGEAVVLYLLPDGKIDFKKYARRQDGHEGGTHATR